MLPGDGVATSPALVATKMKSAVIPPAHMATIMIGWDEDVREVDLVDATEEVDDRRARGRLLGHALADEHERQEQAEARSGVRLEQEVDRLAALRDLLATPSGASTPWLIALFRKRTLATSIGMSASGSRPASMIPLTKLPSASEPAVDQRADAKDAERSPGRRPGCRPRSCCTSISKPMGTSSMSARRTS